MKHSFNDRLFTSSPSNTRIASSLIGIIIVEENDVSGQELCDPSSGTEERQGEEAYLTFMGHKTITH